MNKTWRNKENMISSPWLAEMNIRLKPYKNSIKKIKIKPSTFAVFPSAVTSWQGQPQRGWALAHRRQRHRRSAQPRGQAARWSGGVWLGENQGKTRAKPMGKHHGRTEETREYPGFLWWLVMACLQNVWVCWKIGTWRDSEANSERFWIGGWRCTQPNLLVSGTSRGKEASASTFAQEVGGCSQQGGAPQGNVAPVGECETGTIWRFPSLGDTPIAGCFLSWEIHR